MEPAASTMTSGMLETTPHVAGGGDPSAPASPLPPSAPAGASAAWKVAQAAATASSAVATPSETSGRLTRTPRWRSYDHRAILQLRVGIHGGPSGARSRDLRI